MADAILVADSIAKRFGHRKVLSSATLRARPGEVTLLIGRSGIGKSTLLKCIMGFIPADHGTITFDGTVLLRPHWHLLARSGLFFLSDRDALSTAFTVREHIAMFARRFASADTDTVIALTGIEALLQRKAFELSSGERRRTELATALIRNPICLLADEPYRSVAPRDREVITQALRALAMRGCAVVVTGHEVNDLMEVADQVTWCTDGTTYELGPPAAAVAHWRFGREYLGAERIAGAGAGDASVAPT